MILADFREIIHYKLILNYCTLYFNGNENTLMIKLNSTNSKMSAKYRKFYHLHYYLYFVCIKSVLRLKTTQNFRKFKQNNQSFELLQAFESEV